MMNRHDRIVCALERIAPRIPAHESGEVVGHALSSKGLSKAAPEKAAWLSLVAYVRHTFTDYDALLADGYDQDSARHFCLDDMIEILSAWGCERSPDGVNDQDSAERSVK